MGIIPAYAGSTTTDDSLKGAFRDHPRVCGEHLAPGHAERNQTGSSPRMRGALRHLDRHGLAVGIIPAYAGSTNCSRFLTRWHWDHPRVCGEHSPTCASPRRAAGSSPRMRGALAHLVLQSALFGIIPAYAGSTWNVVITASYGRDHPRVCGEHQRFEPAHARSTGSSPRMRGARLPGGGAVEPRGIIPAYAGSTRG